MDKKKRRKRKLEKIEWTTVNISKILAARIDKLIHPLGYKSISDYVDEAVRRKLENDEWRVKMEKKEDND